MVMTSRIRFRSSHKRIAPLRISHHAGGGAAAGAPPGDDFDYMRDRDAVDERLVQGQRGKKHNKKRRQG
jgi:hypothetical protein